MGERSQPDLARPGQARDESSAAEQRILQAGDHGALEIHYAALEHADMAGWHLELSPGCRS